jgi:hypothetical protein
MNLNLHQHLKIAIIAGTALLAGCEKHIENSTDAPGVHHPPNEIGAPTRTPAPEGPQDTPPNTGSQGTVPTGLK